MKKVITFLFNFVLFLVIVSVAGIIAFFAYTKKSNNMTNLNTIMGTVIKKGITIYAGQKGVIDRITVRIGQEVNKGDTIIVLRPLNTLADSKTAQTNKEQQKIDITSPTKGVIDSIILSENTPVDGNTAIMTMYSNEQIQFLVSLTPNQYTTLQQASETSVYSKRLSQNYIISYAAIKPSEQIDKTSLNPPQKKIDILFDFQNGGEASQLLNNEDLSLRITPRRSDNHVTGFIMDFWNSLLSLH